MLVRKRVDLKHRLLLPLFNKADRWVFAFEQADVIDVWVGDLELGGRVHIMDAVFSGLDPKDNNLSSSHIEKDKG